MEMWVRVATDSNINDGNFIFGDTVLSVKPQILREHKITSYYKSTLNNKNNFELREHVNK
jgi:hypothetical protein